MDASDDEKDGVILDASEIDKIRPFSPLISNVLALEKENAKLQAEVERLKDEDAAKDDKMLEMEGRYKKELDIFREVLRKISEWGCNGQCVELIKTKCPCCIAGEFLENKELQNGKSTD